MDYASSLPVVSKKPDDYGVKKDDEWYRQNALWVAGNYNPIIRDTVTVARSNGTTETGKVNPDTGRWASNCQRQIQYWFAEQNNVSHGHFVRDEKNNPLSRIINGQTIFQLLKHIEGNLYLNYIKGFHERVGVCDGSPDFQSERMEKFALAKMVIDMRASKVYAASEIMKMQPVEGQEFESLEQIQRYKEESPMEHVERIFTGAARKFLLDIHYEETLKKVAQYLTINYFSRVQVKVENGQLYLEIFRPDQCIWDQSVDDDFGRKARIWGTIQYLTIPELLSRYKFEYEEKTELQAIANSKSGANFPWWNLTNTQIGASGFMWFNITNSIPRVAVAQTYWKSLDEGKEVIYRCDLIGNRYIRNQGLATNMIEDKMNKANVEPPFLDFIPDMLFGRNKGFIDRLADISDRIDALQAKMDLFINRAKGKVVFIDGAELPEGVGVQEVATDLSTVGLTVVTQADVDEMAQNKRNLITLADLTIDGAGILAIRSEIKEKQNECKEILSIPAAALGQATPTGSNRELMNTIAQASYGMTTFYEGFGVYLNNIVQRATDIQKIVYTMKESEMVLDMGNRDFEFVKFLKPWTLKKLDTYIDQKDYVTPEDRQKYDDYAFNYSQNPTSGVSMSDVVQISTMTSKREIVNYLKTRERVFKAEQKMKEAQAAIDAQEQAAAANQTQEVIADKQVQGNLEGKQMDIQGKLAVQAMKESAV